MSFFELQREPEILTTCMEIDKRLTEINIFKLVKDIGVPFEGITDEDIAKCLEQQIFLTPNSMYNASMDNYSHKDIRLFDLLKIATIVNAINHDSYNYNYPIAIWEDEDTDTYDADGNGLYHIRAFHYCRKNIYLSVNHSP